MYTTPKGHKERVFVCRCDCGNIKQIRDSSLKSGHIESCGCFGRERSAATATKHGLRSHPLYVVWKDMIQRCTNPKRVSYNLRKAPENQPGQCAETDHRYGALVDNDFIKAIVQQYNFEVQTGLKLIELYDAAQPYMLSSFPDSEGEYWSRPVIDLKIGNKSAEPNNYIEQIRKNIGVNCLASAGMSVCLRATCNRNTTAKYQNLQVMTSHFLISALFSMT